MKKVYYSLEYEEFLDNVDKYEELNAEYNGRDYLISRCAAWFHGFAVVENQAEDAECCFEDFEEFKEKATIGGDSLRDVFSKIRFFN